MNLKSFFHDYIMKLHPLYMGIESEGIAIDLAVREQLHNKYSALEIEYQKELDEIVGSPINVNSPKQVGDYVFRTLKFPLRKSVDEDTLVALIANHTKTPEQRRPLDLIIDLRKVRKTRVNYIEAMPDYDGRMRTSYRILGTETGRPSTSILEAPLRPHKIGLAFTTITKHGDIGSDIRSMFIADPGYIIGEVDKSQAEARIVAHLAGDEILMDKINNSDVHTWTASLCFGIDEEHIDKDSGIRFVGKTGRHLAHYGGGKGRLLQEIMTGARKFHINVKITESMAGKVIQKIHEFSPKIRGVFHKEIEDFLLANERTLTNPIGRVRQFYDRWGNGLLGEAFAQIPQSTVSDELRLSMLEVKKRIPKLRIWLDAYDAFAWQSKESDFERDAKIIKEEVERETDYKECSLSRGVLKIPCEIKWGKNYKDLVKYV